MAKAKRTLIDHSPKSSDAKPVSHLKSGYRSVLISIGCASVFVCFSFVTLSLIRVVYGYAPFIGKASHPIDIISSSLSSQQSLVSDATSRINFQLCRDWSALKISPETKARIDDIIDTTMPLWGTYRPDIYFGMKTRTQNALVTGLAWNLGLNSFNKKLRHSVNQDELTKFHWLHHDGKSFGDEELVDQTYGQRIIASFVSYPQVGNKQPAMSRDPTWIQRIESKAIDQSPDAIPERNLLVYLGIECSSRNSQDACISSSGLQIQQIVSIDGSITALGYSYTSGWFVFTIQAQSVRPFTSSPGATDNNKETCSDSDSDSGDVNACETPRNHPRLSFVSSGVGGQQARSAGANMDALSGLERLQRELDALISKKAKHRWFTSDRHLSGGGVAGEIKPAATFLAVQAKAKTDCVIEVLFYDQIPVSSLPELLHYSKTLKRMSSEDIDNELSIRRQLFEQQFVERFPLGPAVSKQEGTIAKMALSSVLGGIGYFHGAPIIGDSVDVDIEVDASDNGDRKRATISGGLVSLLTGTPSRTSFPRGFLWDEGFHQMLISGWDVSITKAVIASWLGTMHRASSLAEGTPGSVGWIPREMILGDIAKSKVPDEFIVQNVNIANPPTFLLVIDKLLRQVDGGDQDQDLMAYLSMIYPLLNEWVQWFLLSQKGSEPGSFRWRGRSDSDNKVIPNTLSSGLDDYPRALVASSSEHHVDLHSWMTKACYLMAKIAAVIMASPQQRSAALQKSLDRVDYNKQFHYLLGRLDDLHWSEQFHSYLDFGMHSNESLFGVEVYMRCSNNEGTSSVDIPVNVQIVNNKLPFCPENFPRLLYPLGDGKGGYKTREVVMLPQNKSLQLEHIPRIGYVNIFPLMLQLLPADSEKLAFLLDHIESPDMLWTDFGLRSIAKTDLFYQRRNAPDDAPYWRGPIWIPINFLVLGALDHYRNQAGPYQTRCQETYTALRENVVRTLLSNVDQTGFLWEQYDDTTGHGIRGHPFSGWTSLVTNIMAEKY